MTPDPFPNELVEAAARALAGEPRCYCPDDWREPFDKARCLQHGGAAYESERSKFWREGAAAKQAEIVKLLREAAHGGNRGQPGSFWVGWRAAARAIEGGWTEKPETDT